MKSAYAKLNRAKQHLAELRRSVQSYRDSDAIYIGMVQRKDPLDFRQILVEYIVKVRSPVPTEQWGLIVGDVLTNLRASLDHALFGHVSVRQTLTGGQESKIQFPIIDEAKNWTAQDRYYTALVDTGVWTLIRDEQPFHAAHPEREDLYLLNKLVNRDKHRSIHVVAYKGTAVLGRLGQHSTTKLSTLPVAQKSLVDGAVLARAKLLRPMRSGQQGVVERIDLEGISAYTEQIEVPELFGQLTVDTLTLLESLTHQTEILLDKLRAGGC